MANEVKSTNVITNSSMVWIRVCFCCGIFCSASPFLSLDLFAVRCLVLSSIAVLHGNVQIRWRWCAMSSLFMYDTVYGVGVFSCNWRNKSALARYTLHWIPNTPLYWLIAVNTMFGFTAFISHLAALFAAAGAAIASQKFHWLIRFPWLMVLRTEWRGWPDHCLPATLEK